jgi:hypothetical protein
VTNRVKIGLDADGMVDALARLHPAYHDATGMPWVCLREWCRIDLLALECWAKARVVGYEIKISRGDMRAELLKPTKRAEAVSRTTQFYFATPAGMLTDEEKTFVEPEEWGFADFERGLCTNPDCRARHRVNGRGWMRRLPSPRGPKFRGTDDEGSTISFGSGRDRGTRPDGSTYSYSYGMTACCIVCGGYGRVGKSRVELEAPTLWVPRDVGLMEVDVDGSTRVVKQAPRRDEPKTIIGDVVAGARANDIARHGVAQLVRHASAYQDPRHRGHRD